MLKEYNIADVLKRVELRLTELEVSKEKFYAESGISSASYSQWNKGVHEPTPKKLKQMADYLNITMEYLLTGEGQKEKPTPEAEGGPKYAPGYELLTPENRAKADSYLAFLLAEQQNGQT